jgi:Glycosyl transferase family 90
LQDGHSIAVQAVVVQFLAAYHFRRSMVLAKLAQKAFTQRFPRLLQSGSLLFKSTRFREWYTERLKPYVHYIPVNYNLTDLEEKITWAYQHPKAAEQIMKNGNFLSKQFFTRKEINCYVYRLILEYHELFEHA